MGIKHSTIKSFGYAFNGLSTALKNEPNLRIHFSIASIALFIGFILRLNYLEWIILFIIIFLVIILELINTVLENLVNIVSPDFSIYAKKAKDISAAAVLVSALVAFIVGIILFLPKIMVLLS